MSLYGNPQLSGKEIFFDKDEIIVSKTDLTGKLTYGNRTFMRMAGLYEASCLGQQHNIIRHPDMPRCVFELLWNMLKDKQEVFAYVNNRSMNGDNYWVFAHVTPSLNAHGEIVGYHSSRRVPNRTTLKDKIIPLYEDLLRTEKSHTGPKAGLKASYAKVEALLKDSKMNFNELMFAMGV